MPPAGRRCVYVILTIGIIGLLLKICIWKEELLAKSSFAYRLEHGLELHPVEKLHAAAEKMFLDQLSRQSTTLEGAALEYKRRYGRKSPPGFEGWFAFARKHASLIVDDYDEMMRSLEKFWKIAPNEILHLLERANSIEQTGGYIKKCSIKKGKLHDCGAWENIMSRSWSLESVIRTLPDMTFLTNYMDEPVVLASHLTPSIMLGNPNNDEKLPWTTISRQPIWPLVQNVCTDIGEPKHLTSAPAVHPHLELVRNVTGETDLCRHPEFRDIHGYLTSPVSSRLIDRPVPILSRAASYPFSDILYPAPSYSWAQFSYNAWRDRVWQRKINALYWAGSNTGSYTHDETWRGHHRQRLVLLGLGFGLGLTIDTAEKSREKNFTYLHKSEQNKNWVPYTTSHFDKSLYHMTMTKIWECDEPACKQQQDAFHPPRKPKSSSEPYQYKYVFDIDGNSLSGRFYRLLASNSAVLKTTIFKEWHDERLVPWLHYIPVSLCLDELPELVRFLATTNEGREIGHRVAQEGKRWHTRGLREVDRGIYFYRLLIELAWLQNPKRVAG